MKAAAAVIVLQEDEEEEKKEKESVENEMGKLEEVACYIVIGLGFFQSHGKLCLRRVCVVISYSHLRIHSWLYIRKDLSSLYENTLFHVI